MDSFTRTLVEFTVANIDRCSRNWLETVIEWVSIRATIPTTTSETGQDA